MKTNVRSGLSVTRKLLLGIVAVIYMAGGYGISQTSMVVGFAPWEITIFLALFSILFVALGWGIYNFNRE